MTQQESSRRPWWKPAPGWYGTRSFRERIDLARLAVVKAGKHAGQATHRVAAQGLQKAKLSGAKLARHVISVQKAAGVTDKMLRESARSVANRTMTRPGDRAWQAAYVGEAQRLGALPAPERAAATVPAGPASARPSWPHITPTGPDREAGG
jgi:hypothetical protein